MWSKVGDIRHLHLCFVLIELVVQLVEVAIVLVDYQNLDSILIDDPILYIYHSVYKTSQAGLTSCCEGVCGNDCMDTK